MNIERMNQLADELERPTITGPDNNFRFNIVDFGSGFTRVGQVRDAMSHPAYTVWGCIGVVACLLFCQDEDPLYSGTAQDALGLTNEQRRRLFFYDSNFWGEGSWYKTTREQAAQAVRRMVAEHLAQQPQPVQEPEPEPEPMEVA